MIRSPLLITILATVVLGTDSAINGFTAIDLLTGAVLLLVILILKWVADLRRDMATIVEWKEHVPTKEEVTEQVTASRHLLRSEITDDMSRLQEHISDYRKELEEISQRIPRRKGDLNHG